MSIKIIFKLMSVFALVAAITGCGGAGSSSAPDGLPNLIIASSIVDVNSDGKNDIIVTNGQSADGDTSPRLYINNGDGSSFTRSAGAMPVQYNGKYASVVDVKPGDYNGDGKTDLLLITVADNYLTSKIQLFIGDGKGGFSEGSSGISNGNWPDISFTCTSSINSNNAGPMFLRVADVDGDGNSDFVLSFGGIGTCGGVVYLGDGHGGFAPVQSISITDGTTANKSSLVDASGNYSTEVLDGDLNGDGKVDFFAPRLSQFTDAQVAYINTSTPGHVSFRVVHSSFPSGVLHGALLDINGDGKLDLVASESYRGPDYQIALPVNAYRGDGLGGFTLDNTLFVEQPSVKLVRQFVVADLNKDGRKDLLLLDSGPDVSPFPGEKSWLLLNNGAGKLANVTSSNFTLAAPYTHQGAVGDINGDGFPDLFVNNSFQPSMQADKVSRVWLNNGAGVFTATTPAFK